MKTLNLNKILLLACLFLVAVFFSNNANATCVKVGDVITTASSTTPVTDTEEGAGDQCSDTPDFYKLSFFKLGLCKTDPSKNDLSSCEFIINSAAGIEHEISYPASAEIDIPEFTITPGTYPFSVALIGNRLGIKHSFQTSVATSSAGAGSGVYCWTSDEGTSAYTNEVFTSTAHGVTTEDGDTAQMATCGTTAGTAVYTYEIINILSADSCGTFDDFGDLQPMGIVGNGTAKVALLKNDDTYATACENAGKILWTTALTSPFVITEDSTYELRMRTQDAVSMDFSGGDNNEFMKTGADPIQLYLTVN